LEHMELITYLGPKIPTNKKYHLFSYAYPRLPLEPDRWWAKVRALPIARPSLQGSWRSNHKVLTTRL
jgi:hypothetical protein